MLTKTDIEKYFLSYKHEHLFLLIIAAVAIILAAYFYFGIKKDFYKGMAISILSFAMVFITTSFTEYKKADRLRVVNTYNYDLHPEHLKGKELNRIASVERINTIEIFVLVLLTLAAIGLYYYASKKKHADFLRGIALGAIAMCIIATITLIIINRNIGMYKARIEVYTKEILV